MPCLLNSPGRNYTNCTFSSRPCLVNSLAEIIQIVHSLQGRTYQIPLVEIMQIVHSHQGIALKFNRQWKRVKFLEGEILIANESELYLSWENFNWMKFNR